MTLRAGVEELGITPPDGVELAVYGPYLQRRATSVLDDLAAQILILDDGASRVALVTLDLFGVSQAFTAAVRRVMGERIGVPEQHVLVMASHTHSGPSAVLTRGWGEIDEDYLHALKLSLADATSATASNLRPAKLRLGSTLNRTVPWNRVGSGGEGIVDAELLVLSVENDVGSGDPIALLVNFGCHPVVLGPTEAISADYPGALRDQLNRQFPSSVILFANGTCGDVDPVTNRAAWGKGSASDVGALGGQLAKSALGALAGSEPLSLHTGAMRVEIESPELAFNLQDRARLGPSRRRL